MTRIFLERFTIKTTSSEYLSFILFLLFPLATEDIGTGGIAAHLLPSPASPAVLLLRRSPASSPPPSRALLSSPASGNATPGQEQRVSVKDMSVILNMYLDPPEGTRVLALV